MGFAKFEGWLQVGIGWEDGIGSAKSLKKGCRACLIRIPDTEGFERKSQQSEIASAKHFE